MPENSEQENQTSVDPAIKQLSQALGHFSQDFKIWVSSQRGFSAREMVAVISIMIGLLGMWMNWREQIKLSQVSQIQTYINKVELRHQNLIKAMSKASILVINQINSCPIKDTDTLKKMKAARLNSLVDVRAYSSGITLEINNQLLPTLRSFLKHIYSVSEGTLCSLNEKKYDSQSAFLYIKTDSIFRKYTKQQYRKIKEIQKKTFW